ncbi:alpha/beta fold hydrolase [Streptomyces sp. HB2AG]|uniref:alpha/beta fold hydrolase n=1 Tax=Streptomyces sp. HB2AG TaxID=2983400 RepID=UPI0022AA4D6D|nr:alpha/beta fold hydrolase [Streptomyces sp. HB2AG]MCZ2527742.1 alpha/beta fold hydrolase [Streptomyces sp. HB2AG]
MSNKAVQAGTERPAGGPGETLRRVTSPDGVGLAVREWGDPASPTVVLVHGYPDTGAVWRQVAERLAGRFHVVVPDVRGSGDSDVPRRTRDYALDRLEGDLAAVLDAVSPDAPVHLAGHDWGSIQSWEAVTGTRLRGRIASFTSVSGPCLDHVGHWMRDRLHRPTPRHLLQLTDQLAHSGYIAFFHLPLLPALVWRGVLARAWGRLLELTEGAGRTPGHPAPTLADDAVHGVRLYRANMGSRLARPGRRTTDVPVQVVTPTRDLYVRPMLTDGLERWAPRLRRRPLRAGHWAPLTHAAVLADWIGGFAEEVQAAGEPGSTEEPGRAG